MEVEIKLQPGLAGPRAVIYCGEITPEVEAAAARHPGAPRRLAGRREGRVYLLDPGEITLVTAEGQQVYALCQGERYLLKARLYELEAQLAGSRFARISHSEIANFDWVESLDMSTAGTIHLRFKKGGGAFVSRRYVARIKERLGL